MVAVYDQQALSQLASFADLFAYTPSLRQQLNGSYALQYRQQINRFIDIFCAASLADADYAVLQTEPRQFESNAVWIAQADLSRILKSITYVVFTDRTMEGYFMQRVKDGTMNNLLRRLQVLLSEKRFFNNEVSPN